MPCYVVFCVDSSESELGVLDLTQVSGETLDRCFENVCEPDLIFHAEFTVLMVMEEALETFANATVTQNELEKSEVGLFESS